MSNLEKLAAEIKKQKRYASEDVKEGETATLNARKARKQQAKGRLDDLYVEYKKALVPNLVFVLAYGSGAESFASISKEEGNTDAVSADALYEDLAGRVDSRLLTNSSSSIFDSLSRHLSDIANEIGVSSYPYVRYSSKYSAKVKNKEDVLGMAKTMINEDVGAEIVGLYAAEKATRNAMEQDFDGKVYPVVVYLKDATLAKAIKEGLSKIGARTYAVAVGSVGKGNSAKPTLKLDKADNENVIEALKQIKNKIKGA